MYHLHERLLHPDKDEKLVIDMLLGLSPDALLDTIREYAARIAKHYWGKMGVRS